MMIIIYKITNTINSKVYVGQTTRNLRKRFLEHKRKNSSCIHLCRAFNVYGLENFSIKLITVCHTQTIADFLEQKFIEIYDSIKNGYNLRGGGSRGQLSMDSKNKISVARKGMIFTPEHRLKISKSLIGKYHPPQSPESRLKISTANKGRVSSTKGKILSKEWKKKISKSLIGKSVSVETRVKLSQSLMGRSVSEATREKMSMGHIGLVHQDNQLFTLGKETVVLAIANNNTKRKILLSLGLRPSSANYRSFEKFINTFSIDLLSINTNLRLK